MEDNMRTKNKSTTSRKQLQGPRPSTLNISKESQRSMKSSYKKPVTKYILSPEVIYSEPREFMALVQRLTGQNSSSFSHTFYNPSANDVALLEEKKGIVQTRQDSVIRYDAKDDGVNCNEEWYLQLNLRT